MKKLLLTICLLSFVAVPCFADYFSNSRGTNLNSTSYGSTLYTRQQLENEREEEMNKRHVDYDKVDEYNRQIDTYNRQRNYSNNYSNFNSID